MEHIPILRGGKPYKSLTVKKVPHFRSGETYVEVSQANPGLIAKDLHEADQKRNPLLDYSVDALIELCDKAGDIFLGDVLPSGSKAQSPEDYITDTASTTGLPKSLCRKNMHKIATALKEMPAVLRGLTRGLDLSRLHLDFRKQATSLGAVLPSNSPGVHSLWVPAIALRTGLALKPGAQEPWSPYRIVQAFIKAGCPVSVFGYYPTDHSGANAILQGCGRSLFFGSAASVAGWRDDPSVQIHGPGWSKLFIGEDKIDQWADYLDLIADSAAANGGRSCINASGLWVPRRGREIADALARRLAEIVPRDMDDPEAGLAAFSNKRMAHQISKTIDRYLAAGGAEDMTARYRKGERVVSFEGATYLQPTVIYCERPDHPLASMELLFPFISVVEAAKEEALPLMGSTLVLSAITEDEPFIRELFECPNVDRVNVGPIPTTMIRWDMPHEGNLFELLYRHRAYQSASFERAS